MIRLLASAAVPAERIVTKQIALDDIVDDGFEALLDPAGDDVKVLVAPA
jgi:(R,R)-butanediol dehydrogenase / meso-butanediol dehydrogenase / diacetyl reductase